MVIKQQTVISNDIEQNPGPFYERCYEAVNDFYNDENEDNYYYLRDFVEQLTIIQAQEHPIPFPDDFLNDDKVNIWRKCELKIKRNQQFDENFKKNLRNIWSFWNRALFNQELLDARKGFSMTPVSKPIPSGDQNPKPKVSIEPMSIPLLDTENKPSGFYKYGRSADGCRFFCLESKCQNEKYRKEGVPREALRNHAKKAHRNDINFQKKEGKHGNGIECNLCLKSFSRKQTLTKHKIKYHPDLNSPTVQTEGETQNAQLVLSNTCHANQYNFPRNTENQVIYNNSTNILSMPDFTNHTDPTIQIEGETQNAQLVLSNTLQANQYHFPCNTENQVIDNNSTNILSMPDFTNHTDDFIGFPNIQLSDIQPPKTSSYTM